MDGPKSVELDDLMGGAPIQHREVQEYESNQFKSYFKSGIQILEGGVASGLNHVNINDKTPKLFIVKGKRQPMTRNLFLPLFLASQFFKFINTRNQVRRTWF